MTKRSRQETDTQKVIRHLTRTPFEEMMKDMDSHKAASRWHIDPSELLLYAWETHGWTSEEIDKYLAGD